VTTNEIAPINRSISPITISLNVTTNEIAPINRSISQSVNQSTNRLSSCSELSLHPLVNRSIDQSINPSIHQSIRHSIIESLNHSIDQSDRAISRFDQPVRSIAPPLAPFPPAVPGTQTCIAVLARGPAYIQSIFPAVQPAIHQLDRLINQSQSINHQHHSHSLNVQ